jgi:hypothetical protein
VLIAFHCVNRYDRKIFQGRFSMLSWIGSVADWDAEFDVAYIVSPTKSVAWDGPWDLMPGYTKAITGTKRPAYGGTLCTSGSASGIRCGGRVISRYPIQVFYTSVGRTQQEADWELVDVHTVYVWFATQVDNQSLGGQGDSGGPAWENPGTALGLIQGIDTDYLRPCIGQTWPGRLCSLRVGITDIVNVQNERKITFTGF